MYEQYGPELLESVANEMIRYTEAILRERIESFGDGEWTEELALEAQDTWRMKVALRKRGDRLVFDFTGTDPQAVKGVNLPFHGTFGFCFAAVLTTLVYDLPKNHGVLRPLEVIAPEGTLVNVKYPGPVSMNTTSCGFGIGFLASSVLMQMLGTHEHWKDEIVTPNASHRNGKHSGVNQYGRYCVFNLAHGAMDGNGARAHADGIDSGGNYMNCPNAEWFELNFPVLYLFRRHAVDSAGPGRFRGGLAVETAHTPHDVPEGKLGGVAYGVAGLRNSGHGMYGGYPGAPSVIVLREGTRVHEVMERDRCAVDLDEVGGQRTGTPVLQLRVQGGGRPLHAGGQRRRLRRPVDTGARPSAGGRGERRGFRGCGPRDLRRGVEAREPGCGPGRHRCVAADRERGSGGPGLVLPPLWACYGTHGIRRGERLGETYFPTHRSRAAHG